MLRGRRRREGRPWWPGVVALLLAGILAGLAGGATRHPDRPPPDPPPAVCPTPPAAASASASLDLTYDQALRQFVSEPARRRLLAAQIHASATAQGLDPDLLFAIVAVESGFNPRAVSPRGARGLGQLLFGTARAVDPERIRRPGDLFEPARNLDATARLLRALLVSHAGSLDRTLRAYYAGPWDRAGRARDRAGYASKVTARYAGLKALRVYRRLLDRGGPSPEGSGLRAQTAPRAEG